MVRYAAIVTVLVASTFPLAWPEGALAANGPTRAMASPGASDGQASSCASQPVAQTSALLSSYLTTALPLLSQAGLDTADLSRSVTPSVLAPTTPVQILPELDQSIATMRTQPKLDVRWQATFLAPVGSGWLTLTPPNGVDGQGTMASRSWQVSTSGDRTTIRVDDKVVGDLPSSGVATALRDVLVSLPCYASNAVVRHDGASDHVDGRLEPGAESETLRQMTGLVVPGSPISQFSLAIDPKTKTWQSLEIRLIWAIVDVDVLGHRITWGPGGRVSLAFGDEKNLNDAAAIILPRRSPSAAQIAMNRLNPIPALQPVAGPASEAFAFLDVRQLLAMRDEQPIVRAAVETAWQRGGENSPDYRNALRRYRDWERQTPLVGPFLRYVFPEATSQ